MLYIDMYIYIHTQNSLFGGSVLEKFLDRFFNDFLFAFRYGFKGPLEGFDEIRVGF